MRNLTFKQVQQTANLVPIVAIQSGPTPKKSLKEPHSATTYHPTWLHYPHQQLLKRGHLCRQRA
eukprot:4244024-Amphidinium_carterae.1